MNIEEDKPEMNDAYHSDQDEERIIESQCLLGPEMFGSLSEPVAEFKLVLLGIDGIGKTSYVNKFRESKESRSTENYEITPLTFFTTIGCVKLNVWDAKSAESFEKCKDEFLLGADCAILFFDVTYRPSYRNIPILHKELIERREDAAIVLVGNKADVTERKVKPRNITYHRKKNLNYFDISVRGNYQIEKPLLNLLRLATKQPSLLFVEIPAFTLPEKVLEPAFLEELEAFKKEMETIILPEDEEV